jgi:RNA polymerase sigma factor (sigma-70 family)
MKKPLAVWDENDTEQEALIKWRRLCMTALRGMRWDSDADREDAEQEAMMGLLEAHRSFDPTRGKAFSLWAFYTIRRRVSDHFRRIDHLTRNHREDLRAAGIESAPLAPGVIPDYAEETWAAPEDWKMSDYWLDQEAIDAFLRWFATEGGGSSRDLSMIRTYWSGMRLSDVAKEFNLSVNSVDRIFARIYDQAREFGRMKGVRREPVAA